MKMKAVYEGLGILMKYGSDPHIATGHDEIFAGGEGRVSADDRRTLKSLGWGYNRDVDCWSIFV